jgi:Flp pilus assembly pilin Flp
MNDIGRERGAAMNEFALLLTVLVVLAMGSIKVLGNNVGSQICESAHLFGRNSGLGMQVEWTNGRCIPQTTEDTSCRTCGG